MAVHGCWAVIHVLVVALRLVQLKLYDVACNHTHASAAAVIASVPLLHSYHELFVNVNVGLVPSYRYVTAVHVQRFRDVSFTRKLIASDVVKFSHVL